MSEIFKSVIYLSVFGSLSCSIWLVLSLFSRRIKASVLCALAVIVLFSMLAPIYKLFPIEQAERLSYIPPRAKEVFVDASVEGNAPSGEASAKAKEVKGEIKTPSLASYIPYLWLLGAALYLAVFSVSYLRFCKKARKNAIRLDESEAFCYAKKSLKIRRRIRVFLSPAVQTPLLVGIVFPTVYLPCIEIDDEKLKMVFLHELTHYKRKHLFLKLFSLIVCFVHWFNPFCLALQKKLGEVLELSCDEAATKNLSKNEKKIYMQTILDLAK